MISVAVLFNEIENFSFFPIFLFISPIIVDILTTELKSLTCTVFRWIFGIINAGLFVGCILGFAGVIIDTGDCFMLSRTFMFQNDILLKKTYVGIALVIDILVPFVFLIGAPTQKQKHTLQVVHKMEEGKGVGGR